MIDQLIGVLGGSGAVGRTAADRIARFGLGRLRIGGRDLSHAEAVAQAVPGPADAMCVDLEDPAQLSAFCDGCRVVVNCAGPTYRLLDTVARASLAAGAHHVDIGGELVARDRLAGVDRLDAPPELASHAAVFSAGVMPGLSGLLPRLLIAGRPLRRLDLYVGGAAVFTPLSAIDALLTRGPRFGAAMAAWRGGQVSSNALAPLHAVTLPGFPVPVNAWPYLTTEAQTLATNAEVEEVRSYNVFASNRLPDALAKIWSEVPEGGGPEALVPHAPAVVEASLRDKVEHGSFYVMLFTARPHPGTRDGPTRLLLRGRDSYAVSGLVMAVTTRALVQGDITPGAHLAAEALDPDAAVSALRADPLVDEITLS